MKILQIAPEPFFTPRGTPLSVYYRTLVMAELGHEIHLLTYGQGEDVELEGVRLIRIPAFAPLGPIPVGPSILKLFLDGVVLLKLLWLLIRNRYDAVHAHEESVFFSRALKAVFGYKLVYDMHSSLPHQLTNFRFTRSRLLIGLFKKLEDWSLAGADAVITISPALAEYATSLMPDTNRHFLIENTLFDEVRVAGGEDPESQTGQWLRRLPEGGTLIGYAGTFEPYQGIDLLLRAFSSVRRQLPAAHLLLVGGNAQQVAAYRRLAEQIGESDHCLFTGAVPTGVARALMQRCEVLTSPRTTGDNTPLKIYEFLASGKPFVATRILAHTQVLSSEVCYLAEPEPADFARALMAALTKPRTGPDRSAAARDLYRDKYSRVLYVEKIQTLLSSLE